MFSLAEAGSFSKIFFKKAVKNIPVGKMMKMSKSMSSSKYTRGAIKKLSIKSFKPIDRLANMAETIAKKSPINSKVLGSSHPIQALNLYTKGGDRLFKKIDVLSAKTAKIDMNLLSKVQKKLPNMPKLSRLSQKEIINKTLAVTKATGKFGVKIVKNLGELALKHPKSAALGIAYGWFLSDPSGFKKALDNFGGSAIDFAAYLGTLTGKVVGGGISGAINGIENSIMKNITPQTLISILVLFILFLLYKFRSFFVFLFNKIFTQKKESQITNIKEEVVVKKSKRKKGRY